MCPYFELKKASKQGRTAIIMGYNYLSVKTYDCGEMTLDYLYKYLKDYLKYDKVYILAGQERPNIPHEKFLDKDILYHYSIPNRLVSLNINDVYIYANKLCFFGGVLPKPIFSYLNRLIEWRTANLGELFVIQDDPNWYTVDAAKIVNYRVFDKQNISYKLTDDYFDYVDNYRSGKTVYLFKDYKLLYNGIDFDKLQKIK